MRDVSLLGGGNEEEVEVVCASPQLPAKMLLQALLLLASLLCLFIHCVVSTLEPVVVASILYHPQPSLIARLCLSGGRSGSRGRVLGGDLE